MKLSELIHQFRVDCDDQKPPFLWTDESVRYWLNEAQEEAARRAWLLTDSTSPPLVHITVCRDEPWVSISPHILWIKRAMPRHNQYRTPVSVATVEQMDYFRPGWESERGKILKGLVMGMESDKLRAYPVLDENLDVDLTVWRLPLYPLEKPDDRPEIRLDMHRHLLDWAKYRAYSVDDVDTNDPQKADKCLAAFTREFGTASGRLEQWLRENGGRDMITGDFA